MEKERYGIEWNDSYKLGEESVDAQHRRLFELLNDLVDSCYPENEVEQVRETLDFLVNYTVQHFTDEEVLQIACGYPDYKRHVKLHEEFKKTVGELVREFNETGSTEELRSNLNRTVVRWLVNHIYGEDKKIGVHITESGYKP